MQMQFWALPANLLNRQAILWRKRKGLLGVTAQQGFAIGRVQEGQGCYSLRYKSLHTEPICVC